MHLELEEVDQQPGIEDGVLDQLLSEEEIRQGMNAILRRMPAQRKRLVEAFKARADKYSRTWVAISLMDPTHLHTDEAKAMMQKFVEKIGDKKHKPLTVPDKQALLTVDLGNLQTEYEVAELIVKMDQEYYQQLNKQLQWYMNVKDFTGPTVPMGRNPISATDAIYKGLSRDLDMDTPYTQQLINPFTDTDHTPEEIREAIEEGVIDPSPEALESAGMKAPFTLEDPAGTDPFEAVIARAEEPTDILQDQEGVPIHEPEDLPVLIEQEKHWLDELVEERDAKLAQPEVEEEEAPPPVVLVDGVSIGGLYGRPTYREHVAEQEFKKKGTPVMDAIARIGNEEIAKSKSTLSKVMNDPVARQKADDEVFGPRDDENDPTFIDPEKVVDWTVKL